ncbi:helix-turn-helix domain-containing protein [Thiohalobacter sp. IOR34]|uniref:helix-turn-helix domain-containing protein n=1 Tax=Thiohalobacter sp. IOR34 TaxID=3057176 RepID=UPI0025AF3787|nr:helix-turn-helix domain-containing protein [Thiohalobacter sp. IOR34]WJW75987.1 helix-turn-helix domain-containing protein [Thiohalobacter sp. IOR34]
MLKQGVSSRQASRITGLTPRQLRYWRETGLLSPSHRTAGGHARYSFTDLLALKTARQLRDAGVSVQRIRHCVQALTRFLPQVRQPLHELSLVVTGEVVLVIHDDGAFDALSGQQWVLPVARFIQEVEAAQRGEAPPEQAELFPLPQRQGTAG